MIWDRSPKGGEGVAGRTPTGPGAQRHGEIAQELLAEATPHWGRLLGARQTAPHRGRGHGAIGSGLRRLLPWSAPSSAASPPSLGAASEDRMAPAATALSSWRRRASAAPSSRRWGGGLFTPMGLLDPGQSFGPWDPGSGGGRPGANMGGGRTLHPPSFLFSAMAGLRIACPAVMASITILHSSRSQGGRWL